MDINKYFYAVNYSFFNIDVWLKVHYIHLKLQNYFKMKKHQNLYKSKFNYSQFNKTNQIEESMTNKTTQSIKESYWQPEYTQKYSQLILKSLDR